MSVLIASDLDGLGVLHKLGPFVIELNKHTLLTGVAGALLVSGRKRMSHQLTHHTQGKAIDK